MSALQDLRTKVQSSVLLRMAFLGALILILQIPIAMISETISERDQTRMSAIREVASTWGGRQTLTGPVVVVPYLERWIDDEKVPRIRQHYAYFQPETLKIDGEVSTERRYRGIFEVPLYLGSLKLDGVFARPDLSGWGVADSDIQWQAATLVVGVTEPLALRKQVELTWNDRQLGFEPGRDGAAFLNAGIHARNIFADNARTYTFSLTLTLAGTDQLSLTPVARDTDVRLRSAWRDPSFVGAYLPTKRVVDPKGFDASWSIPHIGRNYPQSWRDDEVKGDAVWGATFGVSFLSPVDAYTATTRAVKYQMLFVFMTFLVFYLVELFCRLKIHPVQYLLVGAAMCIFYLLLLALSEHVGFDVAYGLAALPVVGMVGGYCSVILRKRRLGLYIGGELVILYGFLYTLLQVQDYALLVGTLGLLLVLAVVMFVTRRIDWYRIGAGSVPEMQAS